MRSVVSLIVLVVSIVLSVAIYRSESETRAMKEDLVELLKIRYGLFNVDEWKKILTDLIRKKVDELDVQGGSREEMRADITRFLEQAISDFERFFHEESQRSISGTLGSMLVQQVDMFGKIRAYIPRLTDDVLNFMNNPANRDKVKGFVIQKLDEYTSKTFAEVDYTLVNEILAKYKYDTRENAIAGLEEQLQTRNLDLLKYSLIGVIIVFLALILFSKNIKNIEYLFFILVCFSLLMFGVLLPMIEIDARISSISFTLLGEPIVFRDQVLYYKSKSILEVVKLMLTNGRIDVLLVGVLVLLFSVLFPVMKLVCSIIYIYAPSKRSMPVLNFMVFKTGKWSMADVMVVAIFMAYIGFGGIISDQLRQLQGISGNIDILTTNKSALQFGFYLFTSFTVLSLVVSQKIQSLHNRPVTVE
ncbi:MAG TPA: paraquat-inducible protein A [Cyclobacteriaceae bacterium]|nr:paraquat-inducible protein A [Cyclobacteriaceae bacterium]